ncbi:MAG TPA: choice-of-anchor tandem repeat GloVer-containing protein, partial [Bacteroidia bacterium]|nr:choice-of-anchor tandem repeat GloVer-containing protein [Bacteroidia bacterium]
MKKILLSALLSSSLFSFAQTGIWGVAGSGAQYNAGAIFKLDGSGNNYTVKESFFRFDGDYPQARLLQASDGKLYGMTSSCCTFDAFSVFFRYDPATKQYERLLNFDNLADGANTNGTLIQAKNGKLYSVTSKGGVHNAGVLFEFDPVAKTYKKLHDFDGSDGAGPESGVIEGSDGKLYGATARGGANDYGVIFSYDIQTATYQKKFDFNSATDGSNPLGLITQAKNGKIYGLTSGGGKDDFGTLFEFDPVTSSYAVKIEFNGTEKGSFPFGSLVEATDGNLYGTATNGGANDFGVLFQYNPSTAAYKVIVDFDDVAGGSHPRGLMQANDGNLYGGTEYGGTYGDGILYQYDIKASKFTKKFEFDEASSFTGRYPIASLVQAKNGALYGLGYNGGMDNSGTLYTFDITTSAFKKIFDFHESPSGSIPVGGLTQANDKMFYGVTKAGGAHKNGTIYQYDPAFQTWNKKFDFDKTPSGDGPEALMLLGTDGKLYGTTVYGGSKDKGVF